jgi:hypothetical protein
LKALLKAQAAGRGVFCRHRKAALCTAAPRQVDLPHGLVPELKDIENPSPMRLLGEIDEPCN